MPPPPPGHGRVVRRGRSPLYRCRLLHRSPLKRRTKVNDAVDPADAAQEVADRQVDDHRVASLGQVTGALDDDELGPGQLRHGIRAGQRLAAVVVAVDEQERDRRSPFTRALVSSAEDTHMGLSLLTRLCAEQALHAPFDEVLRQLGRVRLGQQLAGEELQEPPVVLLPVAAGVPWPSPRRCPAPSSKAYCSPVRMWRGEERRRPRDRHERGHPVGVLPCCEHHLPGAACRCRPGRPGR